MVKRLHLSFLIVNLFFALSLNAQNLVINPGFENVSSCPTGISEFPLCLNWSNTTTSNFDTCTTPDLYSACASSNSDVNVPNALLGYHQPHTGSNFAGIILGDGLPGCILTHDNYREYIEGQLSSPLVSGQQYRVTFYMSLASGGMMASNSISVYFSDTLYLHDACPQSLIPLTPQLNYCGSAITNTNNWEPLTWLYTATGGEQYFIIGNFKNDSATNHTTYNCSSLNPYIYYYIDDVSVNPVMPADTCNFFITSTSIPAICNLSTGSASVIAYGCSAPFKYMWSTADTGATINNVPGGNYLLTVTDNAQCSVTSAITIDSGHLLIALSDTNPACGSYGAIGISIADSMGPYTYQWSNGDTVKAISHLLAGQYVVTVTNSTGCFAADTTALTNIDSISVIISYTIPPCNQRAATVTATVTTGPGYFTYLWLADNDTAQTIPYTASGLYAVIVTGYDGCSASANQILGNPISTPNIGINVASTGYCPSATNTFSTYIPPYDSAYVYQWYYNHIPVGINANIYTTNNTHNNDSVYAILISYNANCQAWDTAISNLIVLQTDTAPMQQICLVTTDTALQQNVIVWEKADKIATDSFYIYRADTNFSVYTQIAAIGADSLSAYYDVSATPSKMSYRYKINLKDTCGDRSNLSDFQQTIYLQIFNSDSFEWTPYIIENTPSPVSSYSLYRDSTGNGNWQLLFDVPASDTTASIPACPQCNNAQFMIVANLSIACTPTRAAINSVISNVIQLVGTGIEETSAISDIRLLYNPVRDRAEVVNIKQPANLQLTDALGQVLQTNYNAVNQTYFNLNLLAAGFYYIKVTMGNHITTLKMIKY